MKQLHVATQRAAVLSSPILDQILVALHRDPYKSTTQSRCLLEEQSKKVGFEKRTPPGRVRGGLQKDGVFGSQKEQGHKADILHRHAQVVGKSNENSVAGSG